MKIADIIGSIKKELERRTGLPVFIMPQAANNNTAHLELFLKGVECTGASMASQKNTGTETLTAQVGLVSSGTHMAWMESLLPASREMARLVREARMDIEAWDLNGEGEGRMIKLPLRWTRLTAGTFLYPSEEEKNMPVTYTEQFSLSVSYPAYLITA